MYVMKSVKNGLLLLQILHSLKMIDFQLTIFQFNFYLLSAYFQFWNAVENCFRERNEKWRIKQVINIVTELSSLTGGWRLGRERKKTRSITTVLSQRREWIEHTSFISDWEYRVHLQRNTRLQNNKFRRSNGIWKIIATNRISINRFHNYREPVINSSAMEQNTPELLFMRLIIFSHD